MGRAGGRGGGGLSFLASRGLREGGVRETEAGDQNVFNPRVWSGCGARGWVGDHGMLR